MRRLATLCCALLIAVVTGATPLRIMPIGDSITESIGWVEGSGYRAVLRQLLTEAGYEVDYVGSNTSGPGGFSDPSISNPVTDDIQHEGHSGWKIDDIRAMLPIWFRSVEPPHVILLHIGTNDIRWNQDDRTIIDRYDLLLDELARMQPSAKIIATTLLPRIPDYDAVWMKPFFNDVLAARVEAHRAKGQNVHFLDMYPNFTAGPEGHFPDSVHPNEAGFRIMANLWKAKILEIQPPDDPLAEPAIGVLETTLSPNYKNLTLTFSQPLGEGADVLANYSASSADFAPIAVTRLAEDRSVTLTFAQGFRPFEPVTFTFGDIKNASGTVSLKDQTFTYVFNRTGARYLVPESGKYRQVYAIDLPYVNNYFSAAPAYAVDEHVNIGPFTRVAYYVELQNTVGEINYLWVSMDAFTDDASKLGIPTLASGAVFWQPVANLNIRSNVPGLTSRDGVSGKLEFSPYNYGGTFDANDSTLTEGAFGSMQIHAEGSPLFCFNAWGGVSPSNPSDLGLGVGSPIADWTLSQGIASWPVRRRLEVFVLESAEPTPAPKLVSAELTLSSTRILATFDRPVADTPELRQSFSLSNGAIVKEVTCGADHRMVTLTTTLVPSPEGVMVTATQVAADTPARVAGTSAVALSTVPAAISARVGEKASGYRHLYTLDIPEMTAAWTDPGRVAYGFEDFNPTAYDRVAYYLELETADGNTQWAWISCDRYAEDRNLLALKIPFREDGVKGRYDLTNVEIASNVDGVPNGTGLHGVAELGSGSYDVGDDGHFDWNDILNDGWGHGCFQFFETDEAKTRGTPVLCVNSWDVGGQPMSLGLGLSPTEWFDDWTMAFNGNQFAHRRLYAFVRPSANPAEKLVVPEAVTSRVAGLEGYQHLSTVNLAGIIANYGAGVDMQVNHGEHGWEATHEVDNSEAIGAFNRVGYLLELKDAEGSVQWIWTAFDADSSDPADYDIPTPGHMSQRIVTNLDVASNVAGITTGCGISTGNIEFTPYNYGSANTIGIPGANDGLFDFGDEFMVDGGFGSMQVHNYAAQQTLWAVNGFNSGTPSVGIGSCTREGAFPDWTMEPTSWTSMKLFIVVRPGEFPAPPKDEVAEGVDEFAEYVCLGHHDVKGNYGYTSNVIDYKDPDPAFDPNAPFDRIAYALELESTDGVRQWVWTSMDAYTDDSSKLGLPSVTRGIFFWQSVGNLTVRASENANVKTGDWAEGLVEITPSDYGNFNKKEIPGATNEAFDFGDDLSMGGPSTAGFGCLQIHNGEERETVFGVSCLNGWGPGVTIGTYADGTDATMAANFGNFTRCRLRVYVRPTPKPGIAENRGYGPQFALQPLSQRVSASTRQTTLKAYAPGAVRYQWQKNGCMIPEATGSTLAVTLGPREKRAVFTAVAFFDEDNYTVSETATLTCLPGLAIVVR